MELVQKTKFSRSKSRGNEKEDGKLVYQDPFAFMDLIPFPVIYINKNVRYEYVNKAFADWYETKRENVIGKTIREFLGAEYYARIETHVKKALSGEIVNYETEIPYKDTCRYIQATYTPEFDREGNIEGYVALLQDIIEKKKSEKEFEGKQLELQDYVDNASIGLHWVDAEGKIIWANKAELDMFGYSTEEYIGHFISEFHCDKKKVEDILIHLSNNKTIHQYEVEMKCRDGSVKTVLINSNVLWEDGKFIHTRCFTTDITIQKKIFKALQESEQRYRNLIHCLPAAIYTTDENGYITMYNDAAAELWGRHPKIGKDMWCGSWKIYEADGITQVPLDKCPMAIALKEKRKIISNVSFIVIRPDGYRRYFIH